MPNFGRFSSSDSNDQGPLKDTIEGSEIKVNNEIDPNHEKIPEFLTQP